MSTEPTPRPARCLILTLTMATDPSPSSPSSSSKLHRRELWGWLSYAFASEVFVIVSLTLFLPICLEQFARDNGFLLPDKTVPCSSSPTPPVGTVEEDEARCVVKLGWAWIDTASFRCVGPHLVWLRLVFAGGSCSQA
jgi:UMF1 family MFS transporter